MYSKLISFICIIALLACSPKIKGPNYNIGSSHNQTNSLRHSVISKEVNRNLKNTKRLRKRSKYSRIAKKRSRKNLNNNLNNKKYIR